jgi:hypothetical protein
MWLYEETVKLVILVDIQVNEHKNPGVTPQSCDENDSGSEPSLPYGLTTTDLRAWDPKLVYSTIQKWNESRQENLLTVLRGTTNLCQRSTAHASLWRRHTILTKSSSILRKPLMNQSYGITGLRT